jgi:hypothetical protein
MRVILLLIAFVVASSSLSTLAVEPVTPDASPEARAVLEYLHEMKGRKTLAGQMWVPWGADEIETVERITGKLPAIRGHDYIHARDNMRENELMIEWWRAGGIPTVMWHWGAPIKGEGYNQSKMAIDMSRCFVDGTPEHQAMWQDLARIADSLAVLRDAGVPVLWRPMHEFDGGWFWYGMGTDEQFVRLWRTMFDYFAKERKLNNLIWVLCHSGRPRTGWDPGKEYYDLAGADHYGRGTQKWLYDWVKKLHGDEGPIPYHECGTIPDPDKCFAEGTAWSWWMLWHTGYLRNHDQEALKKAYQHERIITRDELPRFVKDIDRAARNSHDAGN